MKFTKYLFVLLISIMFLFSACSTGVVPPGTVVIVAKTSGENVIKTSGKYTSWGRDRLYFIDGKMKTFAESMQILCADDVNMGVDVKWLGNFEVDKKAIDMIKNKVPATKFDMEGTEAYQLSLEAFYKQAIQPIIRSRTRKTVSPFITDAIKENRDKIELDIKKAVVSRLTEAGYPVKTTDFMVSNLDYDKSITETRKAIKAAQLEDKKQAALAKAAVAQAKRDAEIAREKGLATIERAKAEAASNNIRSASITPQILAMEQWNVLGKLATGPNNDVVIIPYEALRMDAINPIMTRQMLGKTTTRK